jgi:hypothetical protein
VKTQGEAQAETFIMEVKKYLASTSRHKEQRPGSPKNNKWHTEKNKQQTSVT